ncbi:thiamine-triphosphatase isoform X2 [Hemicordylus capensis]|uniref:thiamine-triphosphatase isoform X2 n=1 Tax=Hemicordylus capensis TaxID=884348 RepID=UPI00230374B7|nr:thiamine-triphosphatase isoform X2 [Hemicordylus capensis]
MAASSCSSGGPAAASPGSLQQLGTGPASGSIEVEQKFLYGPDTEEKLVALGASLGGRVSFRDRYYDVPDWRLTLADHWLREREGAGWELKCPPQPLEGTRVSGNPASPATESQPPQHPPQAPTGARGLLPRGLQPQPSPQPLEGAGKPGAATQYQELTCPQEIVARVSGLLGTEPLAGWHNDVSRAVEGLGLEEFASFVTCRRKYRLGNLSVDLDEADFGYAVGEVEVVVGQLADVPEALERIQKLGCQLGFDVETRILGKMSVYLHKFRPAHYQALVQAGRLQKVGGVTDAQGGEGLTRAWGCAGVGDPLPPGHLHLAPTSSAEEERPS